MAKIFFAFILWFLPFLAYAQNVPQPVGWVSDFADVLDQGNAAKLRSLIEEVEQKTTTEIAIVTINSIAPRGEAEYARLLFDNWKPGKKGKDNGVLVLLAVKERRWRIETGYGVEGILPDGLCGEIGRDYMVPYFKAGQDGAGLWQGTRAIASIIAKDAKVTLAALEGFEGESTVNRLNSSPRKIPVWVILLIFLYAIILITTLDISWDDFGRHSWRHRYDRESWGGGFGGGGGGGGFGGFGGGGGGGGGAGGGF